MSNTYKVLKLVSGEVIFGEYVSNKSTTYLGKTASTITLRGVTRIIETVDDEGVEVSFAPWLPYTDQEELEIQFDMVVTIASLSEAFIAAHLTETETETVEEEEVVASELGLGRRRCRHLPEEKNVDGLEQRNKKKNHHKGDGEFENDQPDEDGDGLANDTTDRSASKKQNRHRKSKKNP